MNDIVQMVAKRITDLTNSIGILEANLKHHPNRAFWINEQIQNAKEALALNQSLMNSYLSDQEQDVAH